VARLYATSKGSMILWGMGVSQHVHGTDNARCLIALALMTGQIGRPGTGLHPLRGQNNVQGASDAGLIPMMFPDYQRVDNPAVRALRAGLGLRPARWTKPGLTVVEIMHAINAGRSAACTSWARTRPCPTPTPTMRAKRWPRSSTWWCRTSS
jgi:formate dehydrogenase major subunit